MKEAEKEVAIPVAESAGTVLKNLYDGKTYTVSADQNVSVTIPAAKDGGTIVLTAETKTEPAPDNTTDDKKPDGKQQRIITEISRHQETIPVRSILQSRQLQNRKNRL